MTMIKSHESRSCKDATSEEDGPDMSKWQRIAGKESLIQRKARPVEAHMIIL